MRYPRDGVSNDYTSNDCIHQYRDLKLFHKEYFGEELSPFKNYTDMKKKNPIQVIDLRFQPNQIRPTKIQLFEEYRGATNNARLFMILIRQRENKMISDGNKIVEVNVI